MKTASLESSAAEAERLTAYHEAGHAVMADICGQYVTQVEITGDSDHTGSVRSLRFELDPNEAEDGEVSVRATENRLKCVLAGTVAEAMVSGRKEWPESSEDLDLAVRLAMQLVDSCDEVLPLLDHFREQVVEILDRNWQSVDLLAAELMANKMLSGAEVRKLVRRSS